MRYHRRRRYLNSSLRYYEHTITKAEKSVFLLHSYLVSVHSVLVSHKCRNKHYKRAFRQVKISNKSVKLWSRTLSSTGLNCPNVQKHTQCSHPLPLSPQSAQADRQSAQQTSQAHEHKPSGICPCPSAFQ